jgi:hypothetical protein
MIENEKSSSESESSASTTPTNPLRRPYGREHQEQMYHQHPETGPEVTGDLPYLIHPPSKLASTASWISFRDKSLRSMIQDRPDAPNLPRFVEQAEKVLAWRATVPPEGRFWKADPAPIPPKPLLRPARLK